MGVADLHDLELIWPSPGPKDVIVTGTFDQWSASIHLAKGDTGFSGTVKVPWGQKIAYKYIVDGRWRCRDDLPQEEDGRGNVNNILETPEKPEVTTIQAPPVPSLIIPLERVEAQGASAVEVMVTAVEFLPPADLPAIRGSPPLPITQLVVDGLDQALSANTPTNEAKLDTAVATEAPSREITEELAPSSPTPPERDTPILPLNDNPSVSISPTNGHEEAQGFATHAPIQFTKELSVSPSVPETVQGDIPVPLESAAAPQYAPPPTDRTDDVPPATTPAAVPELPAKQPAEDVPKPVEQGPHAMIPPSVSLASASSTPVSSTATHKKWRSFFARIKYIFEKNNDKEGKERNRH